MVGWFGRTSAHDDTGVGVALADAEHAAGGCRLRAGRGPPVRGSETRSAGVYDRTTMRVELIGHFKPCMTEIYIPI